MDSRHHHLKSVPPISCKITVTDFDCTQAEFSDFCKFREITIKSCLDNEEADKFFVSFIQEASVRKSFGQLRHLFVDCSPPLTIFDDKPDVGLIRIYTGEKIPAEDKEHQNASYYIMELMQDKALLVEVEEKTSYEFFVIENCTSTIFRTLLEGMMKHTEDEYPRGTMTVIEKLLGKKKGSYQPILDKFFTAMKSGDMRPPQYSDTDEEDLETDSE